MPVEVRLFCGFRNRRKFLSGIIFPQINHKIISNAEMPLVTQGAVPEDI